MIVKTYYKSGHIDVFDTDHMTESLPQKGNLLTNHSIELDDVKGGRIWLSTYYYEAAEQYKETIGPKGLPVARRRDGWSFLLVDGEDMKTLNRVTVDDETVLVRVAGEIVNVAKLHWAFDVADDIIPMAITAHKKLSAQLSGKQGTDAEVEACELMGFPHETFRALTKAEPSEEAEQPADTPRALF